MTFTTCSPAASTTARMSASTSSISPLRSRPMLMTMSTSLAPLAIASAASAALVAVVVVPCGKPITAHTATPLPASTVVA